MFEVIPMSAETPLDQAELLRWTTSIVSSHVRNAAIPVDSLINEMTRTRNEDHKEHLLGVRARYDEGDTALAFERLYQHIVRVGDEALANEAANILIQFEGAPETLRGYRLHRPEDFDELIENEVVRRFADANDVFADVNR